MTKTSTQPPVADVENWLARNFVSIGQGLPRPPRETVETKILELLLFWNAQELRTVCIACKNEIKRLALGLHDRGYDIRETYDRLEDRLPNKDGTLLSWMLDKAFDGVGGWCS